MNKKNLEWLGPWGLAAYYLCQIVFVAMLVYTGITALNQAKQWAKTHVIVVHDAIVVHE